MSETKEKKIESGDSNTDNTEKKNKNISANFLIFLTAHNKQITILNRKIIINIVLQKQIEINTFVKDRYLKRKRRGCA